MTLIVHKLNTLCSLFVSLQIKIIAIIRTILAIIREIIAIIYCKIYLAVMKTFSIFAAIK